MKERRGWLWLAAGVLLAITAGLLTFQIVSELAASASLAQNEDSPTVGVVVATTDIPAFSAITTGMVTRQEMPASLVPQDYVGDLEAVLGMMATSDIVSGELLLNHRLVDPTDPDAPVLYTMDPDQVLITVPAAALLSQLNMLSVGNHIDIAYTSAFHYDEESQKSGEDEVLTSFLSLQNLEVKGLLRHTAAEEGIKTSPDAILLAVSPQEALILKYLTDSGAPMDFFLRSPENNARMTVAPVDEQYLIDYFQLDIDAPVDFAGEGRFDTGTSADSGDTTSAIQSIIRTEAQSDRADEAGGQ